MSYQSFTGSRDFDSNKVVFIDEEFPYENIFGIKEMRMTRVETYVIDTDYDNYMVGRGCIDNSFWGRDPMNNFFVAVRDRKFDSMKTLTAIAEKVKDQIDFNTVVFPYQGPNCTN